MLEMWLVLINMSNMYPERSSLKRSVSVMYFIAQVSYFVREITKSNIG